MLTLTRPHRQTAATLLLAAFLAAPTGYVVWWSWSLRRPEHVRAVERELGRELGLAVRIEGVRYPRPGAVEYRGLVLRDEGGSDRKGSPAELLRADRVHLQRSGGQVTIRTDGLRLASGSPRLAMVRVTTLLQRAGTEPLSPIGLTARSCELEFGGGLRYSLRDLAGTLRPQSGGPTFTASYRVVSGAATSRCELALVRSRRGAAMTTALSFRTTEAAGVPARCLDPFFDSTELLGAQARFEGELTLEQVGAGDWGALVRGTFSDIDLAALFARLGLEHRLSGRARLTVDEARWGDRPEQGPGFIAARGQLLATSGGTIGLGLLQALQSNLHFRLSDRLNPSRPEQEYASLGLGFALEPNGELRIEGALGADYAPGAVLVQAQRFAPLASAPDGTLTGTGLVQTLVPGRTDRPEQFIPARFESLMIQRVLPAPPRVAGATGTRAN